MIEPKEITIDNMRFYLQPLRPLKALRLDKQIISLIIPAIGSIENLSMDTNIDLSTLAGGVSTALQAMDEDSFEKFVIELLAGAELMEEGKTNRQLTENIINSSFRGSMQTIYKLAFEVMKFNKFTPFELVGDGSAMGIIGSLTKPTKKPKTFGNK